MPVRCNVRKHYSSHYYSSCLRYHPTITQLSNLTTTLNLTIVCPGLIVVTLHGYISFLVASSFLLCMPFPGLVLCRPRLTSLGVIYPSRVILPISGASP
jgi:hypothetical protein